MRPTRIARDLYQRLVLPLKERLKERRRLKTLDQQNFDRIQGLLRDRNYLYEKELNLLPELVTPGTTVFDIGANDGIYTFHLSKLVGAEGRVVSIEPGRRAFRALQARVEREGLSNVLLHRVAAGAACGKATLYVPDYTKVAQIECADHVDGPTEKVAVITVDELVRRLKVTTLSLMKVDVEGAEALVLDGAEKTVAAFKPNLVMEIADVHLMKFSTTGQAILERLWKLGYSSFEYVWETRKLKPTREITLKGGHTWSRLDEDLATNNYIFIHRERLDALGAREILSVESLGHA